MDKITPPIGGFFFVTWLFGGIYKKETDIRSLTVAVLNDAASIALLSETDIRSLTVAVLNDAASIALLSEPRPSGSGYPFQTYSTK